MMCSKNGGGLLEFVSHFLVKLASSRHFRIVTILVIKTFIFRQCKAMKTSFSASTKTVEKSYQKLTSIQTIINQSMNKSVKLTQAYVSINRTETVLLYQLVSVVVKDFGAGGFGSIQSDAVINGFFTVAIFCVA